ncbi:tRNA (guanine(46)-N(7))-methyltransferase TrmB [Aquabacter cavernae]|uniref:tRNA (guanine(46)-N(7))-methyltransferase TrmB n=1 Tax=Aquabacter cavernae TaxID=2496029 RepID=UPI00196A3FCA|nr:tRNA (guanine(46)-N(7))-methyltransferase TrmB [Aquabacter cavernae]
MPAADGPRRDPQTGQMASFHGRRVGKPLRPVQAEAHARLFDRYRLSLDALAEPTALFSRPVEALGLEIGFGGGEHLVHAAGTRPGWGFLGVEPFLNGMTRALMDLEAAGLDNVRVFDDDAALVLARLPAASLARVDLFYPDPWPKRRHWKRRFVRPDNLDLITRALKPGGLFRFASDVPDYVDWCLREVRAHGALAWTAETADDWRRPFEGWPGTRYEAKALKAGRVGTYLTFLRP